MSADASRPAPAPSIRRLPSYLTLLKRIAAEDRSQVSCTTIAAELGLDSTQVRKDLALTGVSGKPRVGYLVGELVRAIESYLGWDYPTDAFLAGCGNLGRALMNYTRLRDFGLRIVAAFDPDPARRTNPVEGCPIYEPALMAELARRHGVRVGILAVPSQSAQSAAEEMAAAGLDALWNFSATRLYLSSDVIVENVELAGSLAVLGVRRRHRCAVDG